MTHADAPRAGRTTWRRLALALAPAVLIGTLTTGVAASGAAPAQANEGAAPGIGQPWPDRAPAPDGRGAIGGGTQRKAEQVPNLAPSLQDDAGQPTMGQAHPAAVGDTPDTVEVAVEADDLEAARAAVESVDGTVTLAAAGILKADIRPDRLAELAGADGVRRVSEPRPVVLDVQSEGVAVTQSDDWQSGGYTGEGTTVAIIDGGFGGYSSRLGTELPLSGDVTTDFARCGSPLGSSHGTAVAEVVHDMAPDAQLRLVCIEDALDFVDALDTLPASVDVANGSIGFSLVDRGDGSGIVSAAVARARDRGILYVAAAGNYGHGANDEGTHRHQNAVGDSQGPSLTDLVNMPGGDDGLAFLVAPGSTGAVSLQWDAWPTTALDFDLYIENQSGNIVGGSEGIQNGNDPPIEFATVSNGTGSFQTYFVLVNRFDGAGSPRLDLFFDGGAVAIEAPTGSSVADPGISAAAFTVGAHCYADGAFESFTSAGPTIDQRVKPDISAPDANSSSVYGAADGCAASGFFGTSSSSPHVAGAAAQVLEANPGLEVAELQQLLEDRVEDAGAAGDDNIYGSGRLRLGAPGDGFRPPPRAFTGMTPTRLFDSRPGTQHPSEEPNRTTPIPANSTLAIEVRGDDTGVPADAVAVILNVTAVSPAQEGYFTVFPGGTAPNSSNINFAAGQTAAVHVTATVGSANSVRVFNGSAGTTHVLIDVAGWYGPSGESGPSTDRLTALISPARAMDTRGGVPLGYAEALSGDRTTPLGVDGEIDVEVAGAGGVPSDASAVIMNVTGIAPTSGTFVTAYPEGLPRPTASNLNAKAGQTVANLVVVPIGDDGEVSFYNQLGLTHLAVDVVAYFRADVGAGYVALDPPTRDLDTRFGNGLRKTPLGPNGTFKLKVATYYGVPSDAAAVMLGVVAVTPTAAGWLTVYPGTASLPGVSNVNFAKNANFANAVVSRMGTDGTVAFNNAKGTTHVISDLAGYFIDPANVQLPPD